MSAAQWIATYRRSSIASLEVVFDFACPKITDRS
jgi:hypothetical protein